MLLACSCSTAPQGSVFLRTKHDAWNRFLDEKVQIHADNVPPEVLFHSRPFENLNVGLDYSDLLPSESEAISPRANPVARPEILITFHADEITRREILRQISERYHIQMEWFGDEPAAILMKVQRR